MAEQAEKQKHKGNEEDEDDEKDAKYKRVWYAPWKKVRTDNKAKKVTLPMQRDDHVLNMLGTPRMARDGPHEGSHRQRCRAATRNLWLQ